MLRSALGFTWKDHIRNEDLYMDLPKVSEKVKCRRLKLAGHINRHKEEVAHDLTFWNPTHGHRKRGKPSTTFIHQLEGDTGLCAEEIRTKMEDRDGWRFMVGRGSR